MTNDAGHVVHIHIANYQDRYFGGRGMVRLYRFDLERGRVDLETLSPWVLGKRPDQRHQLEQQEVELSDDANRFSVALDFAQRFAGFAPIPPRAARRRAGSTRASSAASATPASSTVPCACASS